MRLPNKIRTHGVTSGSRASWLCLVLLLSVAASCGGRPPARTSEGSARLSAGPILPPSALAGDFQWRQKVTAIYPTGRRSFEAVLQHHEGVFRLIGLGPMGRPGFVISLQPDARVTVDNNTGRELPFSADYVLADVQRVFFPWLEAAPARYHGKRRGGVRGVQVSESYARGVLLERRFTRDDAPDRGAVTIRYSQWLPGQRAPGRAQLVNDWFGYRLVIETVEQTPL